MEFSIQPEILLRQFFGYKIENCFLSRKVWEFSNTKNGVKNFRNAPISIKYVQIV